MTSKHDHFPDETLRRFESYMPFFRSLRQEGKTSVTVTELAEEYRIELREVRRELAALTGSGELRSTYDIAGLIADIEYLLGYHNLNDVIVVGTGRVGLSLLKNEGFAKRDLFLGPLFDEKASAAYQLGDTRVLPLSQLKEACGRRHTHLAVLAVPKEDAQRVADLLVEAGILAIWNVSGKQLSMQQKVLVQSETFGEHEDIQGNENIALSLVVLAKHLGQRMGW